MPKVVTALVALLCAVALAACGSSNSTSSSAGGTGTGSGNTGTGTGSGNTGTSASSGTSTSGAASAPQIGFEGVPLQQGPQLGPASTTGTGKVHGITCGPSEQLVYHIHAHLAVFRSGQPYTLPAGVGIPGSKAVKTNQGPIASGGSCIYWLHTHTTDGVIHVESPSKAIYTLGDFFDEWHQPLSASQVATLKGPVTAFVNGKPWKKTPRAIPLLPHEDIQLEIGQPAPPIVNVDWSQTQL
jgi:hypothetical protein